MNEQDLSNAKRIYLDFFTKLYRRICMNTKEKYHWEERGILLKILKTNTEMALFLCFLKIIFLLFLRMIRHLPFRTGEVVTLDIFNVDIVVFIFQFGNISCRCVWSAPLGPFKFVRLGVFGQVVGAHETFIANWTSETLFAGVGAQVTLEFVGAGEAFSAK